MRLKELLHKAIFLFQHQRAASKGRLEGGTRGQLSLASCMMGRRLAQGGIVYKPFTNRDVRGLLFPGPQDYRIREVTGQESSPQTLQTGGSLVIALHFQRWQLSTS